MLILQTEKPELWGTPGSYILDGVVYLRTLEPTNFGFPSGEYMLQIYYSPSHGYYLPRFISPNDPAFTDRCIENHPGNIQFDSKGCVLVGDGYQDIDCAEAYPAVNVNTEKFDPRHYLGTMRGLTNSQKTFERMMTDGKIDLGKTHVDNHGVEYYTGGTPITVIRAAV